MARLPIIYLLLSSLLLFNSCAYNRYKRMESKGKEIITESNLKPVIPSDGSPVKYKASIDILNKHFSGIIVLKQTDPTTKHLVFVTELGMRMFDFVMRGDSLKADFVFEPLNKPKLIKALTADFRDILLVSVFNKEADRKTSSKGDYYLMKDDKNNIAIQKDANNFTVENRIFNGKKKTGKIIYTGNYSGIKFRSYGLVKLRIELNRLTEN
jgi:hypothetical protein